MKTWRFFWRLMRFRPWLFWHQLRLASRLLFVIGDGAGSGRARVLQSAHRARGMAESALWWLIALLLLAAAGHVACMFRLAVTNVPFMRPVPRCCRRTCCSVSWSCLPRAALPSSPGEAISRFRDDVDGVTTLHDHLQRSGGRDASSRSSPWRSCCASTCHHARRLPAAGADRRRRQSGQHAHRGATARPAARPPAA